MKSTVKKLGFLVSAGLLVAGSAFAAGGADDTCAEAGVNILDVTTGTLSVDTTGNAVDAVTNTCIGAANRTGNAAWFTITGATAGNSFQVEVTSSTSTGQDTGMSVYSYDTATGNCGTAVLESCNDDIGVGMYLSRLTFNAVAGRTYVGMVQTAWGDTAAATIGLSITDQGLTPNPASDTCAGALVLGPGLPVDETYTIPTTHTDTGDFRGSLLNTTGSGVGGRDLFWSYTPASTALHQLELDYVDASAILGVWTGACGALVEDATVPPQFDNPADGVSTVTWVGNLTAATPYTLVYEDAFVGSFPGGPVSVRIDTATPPANDLCASATVVGALPFNEVVSNVAAGDEGTDGSCEYAGGDAGKDVFYSFTPANNGIFQISALGPDLVVAVYDDGCTLASEVACADDFAAGGEQFTFNGTMGTTYTILVEGWSSLDNGDIDFTVEELIPPAGNECSSAIAQSGPGSTAIDNTGFVDFLDTSCNTGAGGGEHWIALSGLTSGNNYTVETTGGTVTDTALEVLDGSCGSATSVACNDDIDLGGGNFLSSVSFDATHARGGNYYVVSEPWGGATAGTWGVTVTDNGVSSVSDWQLMNY